MNKTHLVESLKNVLSTKKEARDAVEKIFYEMKKALREGNKVVISSFGSFHTFITKSKKCINPRSKKVMHIKPKRKVRFRQAKDLI